MDYEKKYKEALNKAKECLKDGTITNIAISYIGSIFPELKESEDERIRKAIRLYLDWLDGRKSIAPKGDYSIKDMSTWLEKQGMQPRYNIGDIICDKSCTTLNKEAQPNMEIVDIQNGMYICDKGSFPVSQQDEYELVSKKIDTKLNDDSVSNELREASTKHAEKELKNHTFPNNEEFELIYTFEEGAKWQAARKSSWSKDDDDNIGMIESRLIDLLSYTREDNSLTKHRKNSIKEEVVEYVNWLTSLKDRSTWKPSDEQIETLEHFVRSMGESGYVAPHDNNTKLLYSLLEDLKKLK